MRSEDAHAGRRVRDDGAGVPGRTVATLTGACLALALAACQAAAPEPAVATAAPVAPVNGIGASRDATAPSPAGRYRATGPAPTTLEIRERSGDLWHVALRGGATPAGAGTAADCELEAEGPLRDGRLEADVVPFEGELVSLTAADVARAPARVSITFDGDAATVESDYAQCGMGADFNGVYRRDRAP